MLSVRVLVAVRAITPRPLFVCRDTGYAQPKFSPPPLLAAERPQSWSLFLHGRFSFLQRIANLVGAGGVDRRSPNFYMLDLSFFVYYEGRAITVPVLLVVKTILLGRLPFPIAQQGKGHTDLFRERFVRSKAVHADPQYLSFRCVEFGDISLIRLKLLRSATGESENIKCEYDRFLPAKIAELDGISRSVGERKIRRGISYF